MPGTSIDTRYGQVVGAEESGVFVWRGVPYAKPPLGPLRFQPPQPPDPWIGPRHTTQFSPIAPQSLPGLALMSEDCLYLNIWSPRADDQRRPVLVWIHGGGFMAGSGAEPWYDGAALARHGDVVVVTINYRLGLLGFLYLDELGGDRYASTPNRGLLDQVAALRWVRDNIAAFGGDPDRITVFGQSAGATSISVLLAMPAAQGLFRRAILQSGPPIAVFRAAAATRIAEHLIAALDVGRDALATLEYISVERLLEAAGSIPQSLSPFPGLLSFAPVVAGVSLPPHPLDALAAGSARDVAVLIGTTREEFRGFLLWDPSWLQLDDAGLVRRGRELVGPRWPAIAPYYLGDGAAGQALLDRIMSLLTTWAFTDPALCLAEEQVRQSAPVWMYRFDWPTPVFEGRFGAYHSLDIPFVFGTLDQPGVVEITGDSPARQPLADRMQRAWIAFARTGDPTTAELSAWPAYNLEQRATMLFSDENRVEYDPGKEERQVWATLPRRYE